MGDFVKIGNYATGFTKKFEVIDEIPEKYIVRTISNEKAIVLDRYEVFYKRHKIKPKYIKEYTLFVNRLFVHNVPESSLKNFFDNKNKEIGKN